MVLLGMVLPYYQGDGTRETWDTSMSEVPHAGEHHRDAVLIGRGNHLRVVHAAARLDHAARACLDDRIERIPEREEGIGRGARAGEREARVARLDRGDASGIDAAHLAGADAHRGPLAR